jgi:hypothetical protein
LNWKLRKSSLDIELAALAIIDLTNSRPISQKEEIADIIARLADWVPSSVCKDADEIVEPVAELDALVGLCCPGR